MSTSFSPNSDSRRQSEADSTEKSGISSETRFQIVGWILALLMVVAGAEGFYSWSLTKQIQELEEATQTQDSSQEELIQALQDQAGMHDENFTALQADLGATKTGLGTAQGQLNSTRRMA